MGIAKNSRPNGMILSMPCFLRQFIENLDEADDEKQRRTNVNPECRRRNAQWRSTQSGYHNSELLETVQEDLQRWALPA